MKMARLVCCLCLLLVSLMAISTLGIALAQDEEEPVTENITLVQEEEPVPELITAPEEPEEPEIKGEILLSPTFPAVEGIAGDEFEYEMELLYIGAGTRTFDLRTTAPKGWEVYVTPKYETDKKISSVNLEPSFSTGETIRVVATAPFWPLPDPGEYEITFEAVSEEVRSSVELTAKITAKYILAMVSSSERYDTEARAGKDNYFAMEIGNLGTAAIDDIKFSPTKPGGWTIEFVPEKIELLEAFDTQTLDVNIKPPPDTIAGDYYVSVRASGQQTSADEVRIRVTVKTAPTWQWVGIGIIIVVVVGLVVIFMRFSRR